MRPSPETIAKLFPLGPYKLTKYQDQFEQVTGVATLVHKLIAHIASSENMMAYAGILEEALAAQGGEGTSDDQAGFTLRNECAATAIGNANPGTAAIFAPCDAVLEMSSALAQATGEPGFKFVSVVGAPKVSAYMAQCVIQGLLHYVVNKDMMAANPGIEFVPTQYMGWSINALDSTVTIVEHYKQS